MYILQRIFNTEYAIYFAKKPTNDPTERLCVSTIEISVEEQNTTVNEMMQMQIKTLSEKLMALRIA